MSESRFNALIAAIYGAVGQGEAAWNQLLPELLALAEARYYAGGRCTSSGRLTQTNQPAGNPGRFTVSAALIGLHSALELRSPMHP